RILPWTGALLYMRAQGFEQLLVGDITVLEHDDGFGLDEAIAVLLADDGGLEHGVVRRECGLDLERRDPHAVHLEHVVGTAAAVIVTVLVTEILVAGIGPFPHEGATALRTLVPVALAGRWPA